MVQRANEFVIRKVKLVRHYMMPYCFMCFWTSTALNHRAGVATFSCKSPGLLASHKSHMTCFWSWFRLMSIWIQLHCKVSSLEFGVVFMFGTRVFMILYYSFCSGICYSNLPMDVLKLLNLKHRSNALRAVCLAEWSMSILVFSEILNEPALRGNAFSYYSLLVHI